VPADTRLKSKAGQQANCTPCQAASDRMQSLEVHQQNRRERQNLHIATNSKLTASRTNVNVS